MKKRHYETTLIFTPTLGAQERQKVAQRYVNYLKKKGATIVKEEEKLHERRLAYPIGKQNTGLYQAIEFTALPAIIKDFSQQCNQDESVLYHITVHHDKRALQHRDRLQKKSELLKKEDHEEKNERGES